MGLFDLTRRFISAWGVAPAIPVWTMSCAALVLGFSTNSLFAQQDRLGNDEPSNKRAPIMIVATTGPIAIQAGFDALQRGGSSADAVLTTALSQIALAAGSWVSYAGRMTAVYYDAHTQTVYALNACYDAPRAEDDPLSIPRQPTPSGRTVLVPGFMAGVAALHEKFGMLQFEAMFDPAIRIAEQGYVLNAGMAGLISSRRDVLARLAETRAIFAQEDGSFYETGNLLKQPKLAATLRNVAKYGANYMYTGAWAQRFVEDVQHEGGKISLEDLAAYRVRWDEPLRTSFCKIEFRSPLGCGRVTTPLLILL